MSVRKRWLILLVLIAVLAVGVNAFLLSAMTNRYFDSYVSENYERHVDQIETYVASALVSDSLSVDQMIVELSSHLIEPIVRIQVYDEAGRLIADVISAQEYHNDMMRNGLMKRIADNRAIETDQVDVVYDGTVIGTLTITRLGTAENAAAAWVFKIALIRNTLLSIGIVAILAAVIGALVSKRMSKDLIHTANAAQSIDIGDDIPIVSSNIKEVRVIQQSLESLRYRLKLKQKSRKALVDELVHQTRTPLTILKMHLEAMEDGIVEMTPEEIKICEEQVENASAIIANLSRMIDADTADEANRPEDFEFSKLIKQVASGLRMQFDKKQIALKVESDLKVEMHSDKYKISQAIYNILTNAYKFTDKNGTVSVNYKADDAMLTVEISDTGVGIAQEAQDKIFDAYYKASVSESEGIGLYVAKENLYQIGGQIEVSSKLGEGSTFILRIPKSI